MFLMMMVLLVNNNTYFRVINFQSLLHIFRMIMNPLTHHHQGSHLKLMCTFFNPTALIYTVQRICTLTITRKALHPIKTLGHALNPLHQFLPFIPLLRMNLKHINFIMVVNISLQKFRLMLSQKLPQLRINPKY